MTQVLIVEDSQTQAMEIKLLLEEEGFSTEVAHSGAEALRLIRRGRPDLVVTDMMMPEMDGLALVEAIRLDFPFLPVVLVTGFGSERAASEALRAGAVGYVPKRDLDIDLISTLRNVLEISADRSELLKALSSMTRAEFLLDNDTSQVPALVRLLEGGLAAKRFCDPTDLTRVGLALYEALINAIERGNLEIAPGTRRGGRHDSASIAEARRAAAPFRDRRVRVTVEVASSRAVFTIRADGPGFDLSALPDPNDPANLTRTGGRGLLLVRTFMDEVEFNAAGNQITLVKHRTSLADATVA